MLPERQPLSNKVNEGEALGGPPREGSVGFEYPPMPQPDGISVNQSLGGSYFRRELRALPGGLEHPKKPAQPRFSGKETKN